MNYTTQSLHYHAPRFQIRWTDDTSLPFFITMIKKK